jgi:N-acetylmuramoyl-L-alanine amidase
MNWRRVFAAVAAVCLVGAAAYVLVYFLGRTPPPEPDPPPIYVIALDAGHGGRDPGAVVDDVLEKDLNLDLVSRLSDLVDAEPDLVAKMTRTLDIFVSLEDRIRIAEEAGAVVYVSIHINSFSTPEPTGIETIVADARPLDDDSWVLAELIQDGLVNATGARDRGTRSQESYTQRTEIPAVSAEVGYLTNPDEKAKLVDSEYQQRIVEGILAGIRQFIDYKYPSSPASAQP